MANYNNMSSNSVVSGTSSADSIHNEGDYVTIDAGAGNDYIQNIYTNGGDNVSINAGDGNDTIYNDYGYYLTINGGKGNARSQF